MVKGWLALCISIGVSLHNYNADAQVKQYAFRIGFTDKAGSPPLSNPSVFLTQRALDRRNRQGIVIDSTDRPVSQSYIDSVLQLTSGKLHCRSRWFNQAVVLLADSSKILTLQGVAFVRDIAYIAYYPSGLHKGNTSKNKDKSQPIVYTQQAKTTGTQAYYGGSYDQTKVVNGDYLHDHGYRGEDMMIAVLDEGYLNTDSGPAFDSMRTSGRLLDKYDFAHDTTNILGVASTHGTSSLSTMAGYLPGTYVGAAPQAQYLLYISEIMGSEQEIEFDNLVAASERADSLGTDIITISLGYNDFSAPLPHSLVYADIDGKTTLAARAANIATTKGILFVASAGNEGGGAWNYILTPGDADSAMTIGNVDINANPAGNSGYGPNAAGHVKPDVCMVGQPARIMGDSYTVYSQSGTSFATPQLAGWAACLWQASGKNKTPYTLRKAIIESASIYPNHGNQLGYGVPDFQKAFELLTVKDTPRSPDEWVVASPNPVGSVVDVKLYLSVSGSVLFTITDANGRLVADYSQVQYAGVQTVAIGLPELSAGVYFLRVVAPDKQKVIKLLKQ